MLTDSSTPESIRRAAALHVISGAVNLLVMWCVSGYAISCICSLPTFGFASFCGFASLLLLPLGVAEVAIGIWGSQAPRAAFPAMKWLCVCQVGSVLVGGLPSAVAGAVAIHLLRQDEVLAYIEG